MQKSSQGRAIHKAETALERYRAEPGSQTGQAFLAIFSQLKDMDLSVLAGKADPYFLDFPKKIERLRSAAAEIENVLNSVFQMNYVPTGTNDLDKKAFSGDVQTAVKRSLKFNRTDVLRDIQLFLNGQGKNLNISNLSAQNALNMMLETETIGNAKSHQERIGNLLASHPKPPSDALRIHKKSLQLFLEAKCGQAFSGLIHIRDGGSYKVFLAPLMPSQGSLQEPEKIYAVRDHDEDGKYGIYEKRNISFQPIEHYRVFNGVPRASHEQFVGFIKNKYQTDDTTSKKYVGFSVTKGRIAEGVNNRYAFVSRTVNPFTFQSAEGKDGDYVVPVEWQKAIQRTFNRLSIVEYAMHQEREPSLGTSSQVSESVDPSAQSASANEIKIQPSHLRSIQAFLSVSANSSSPQKK